MKTDTKPPLWTSLKEMPRAYWFIILGTFINRCGMLVLPFVTLYLSERGFSLDKAGWALLWFGVGNLLASLCGGQLADTFGRKNTMMLSFFTTGVIMCAFPQVSTDSTINLMLCLVGFAGDLYRPAVGALIADIVPEKHRLAAYAVNRTALNAGFAVGPALGGFMSKYSWDWLFYADGITTVTFGVIAVFALPHGRRDKSTSRESMLAWREVFSNKPFMMFALANLFVALAFLQVHATIAVLVKDSGYETWIYGMLCSLNGAMIVLLELPLTAYTKRFRTKNVIIVGYLMIGAGMMILTGAPTLTTFVLMMVVYTVGEMICMPMSAAYLAELAEENKRGRYMGTFGLTWAISVLLGPKIGLSIYAMNADLWWWICGALCAISATIIYIAPSPRKVEVTEDASVEPSNVAV